MKILFKMFVILFVLGTNGSLQAEDALNVGKKSAANVKSRLSSDDLSKPNRLFIYSDIELLAPSIFRNGSWTLLVTCMKHPSFPEVNAYGTLREMSFRAGDKVIISGVRPDGSRFIDDAVVRLVDDKVKIEVANRENLSAEERMKREEQEIAKANWWGAPDESTGRFMELLNQHRIFHGRKPVYYDVGLAAAALQNNQAGGLNRVALEGSGRQNWAAAGSADLAFKMWRESEVTNANMLTDGVSRAGINFFGQNSTLNLK